MNQDAMLDDARQEIEELKAALRLAKVVVDTQAATLRPANATVWADDVRVAKAAIDKALA